VRWNSLNASDESLRLWSELRIFLFLIQSIIRYNVWNKIKEIELKNNMKKNNEKELINILRSKSWKCTQIGSFIVSLWVGTTIISTLILKDSYNGKGNVDDVDVITYYFCFEGYLSPCLLRWSYVSILIFVSHIIFIIYWLRNVMLIKQNECSYYSKVPLFKESGDHSVICSICIDNKHNEENEFVQLNECLHQFHQLCIDQWFKKKIQCPLCLKKYNVQQTKKERDHSMNYLNYPALRNRKNQHSPYSEAIDVLLQSPISADCGNNNNSLFYFMPN